MKIKFILRNSKWEMIAVKINLIRQTRQRTVPCLTHSWRKKEGLFDIRGPKGLILYSKTNNYIDIIDVNDWKIIHRYDLNGMPLSFEQTEETA